MHDLSGHNFHFDIEDRVKAKGWTINSKVSYLDDVEQKPREIDFVAVQQRESYNPRGNQLALVVECKYLEHDVKFWFRDNPKNHRVYFFDGYNMDELFLDENKWHFFPTARVARDLEERTEKKKNMREAIMQASKALMFLRQGQQMLYTKGLFYPIVVYKGPGRLTDQDGGEVKNVLYYHEYPWKDQKTQDVFTRALYVDIIHESDLEDYLDNVFKKEMDFLMGHVFFRDKMEKNRLNEIRQKRREGKLKDFGL